MGWGRKRRESPRPEPAKKRSAKSSKNKRAPSSPRSDEEGARFSQKFESFLSRNLKDFSKGA
jgi:hypothetical protein